MERKVEIINHHPETLSAAFIESEIEDAEKKTRRRVVKVEISDNGDGTCTQRFWFSKVPFNRIRRITGYLVGDLNRFNDAKAAEVRDRVKHTTCESTEGR